MRNISYSEYRRRVFNTALLECLCKVHGKALNGSACEGECDSNLTAMAANFCKNFYKEELNLDTSTISQTKARLSEAVEFVQDCVDTAENIAEDKADAAKECGAQIPEDQDVELSQEDEQVIDQLFDVKNPELQIDAIRDATVAALVAENEKAQEIKNAMDIAQSQVAAGEDPKQLEETVNRLNGRGPTSLMNAIMNHMTMTAIKDINENGNFTSVGDAMRHNADIIKTRSAIIYSLYESSSILGICKYTPESIRKIAQDIYYAK